MRPLRRTQHELRVEIMPLIDVVFLLLTFFIYALVLVVRPEILPMRTQALESGRPADVPPAATISIDAAGTTYLDREPMDADALIARLQALEAEDPDTVIYLAADRDGTTDRLPVFLSLYDRLAKAGIEVLLVGSPDDATPGGPAPVPPSP